MPDVCETEERLRGLLDGGARYALAFSGGCDSALLLALLVRCGYDVVPYTAVTAFQMPFELDDARDAAAALGLSPRLVEVDVLSDAGICANPDNRCYLCKRLMFSRVFEAMARDGRGDAALIDGTNATDDPARRPGMRALGEMGVVSPLRALGLSKDDVRSLSHRLGLLTARKPSFSCLATWVPAGEGICADSLARAAGGVEGWR